MLRLSWGAAIAAALALTAAPAAAAIVTLNFRIEQSPGREYQHFGDLSGYPYGLNPLAPINGSVTVDDADLEPGGYMIPYTKFLALDFTTGTKTWTLAELGGNSFAGFDLAGNLIDVVLWFDNQNFLTTAGNMALYDGRYGILCNGCVWRDLPPGGIVVPEPAAWALMLLGFAGTGAMVRRRRRDQGVTSAGL